MKANIPEWIKKAKRDRLARERYFIKRYGNLNRMYVKDGKSQSEIDAEEMAQEMIYADSLTRTEAARNKAFDEL